MPNIDFFPALPGTNGRVDTSGYDREGRNALGSTRAQMAAVLIAYNRFIRTRPGLDQRVEFLLNTCEQVATNGTVSASKRPNLNYERTDLLSDYRLVKVLREKNDTIKAVVKKIPSVDDLKRQGATTAEANRGRLWNYALIKSRGFYPHLSFELSYGGKTRPSLCFFPVVLCRKITQYYEDAATTMEYDQDGFDADGWTAGGHNADGLTQVQLNECVRRYNLFLLTNPTQEERVKFIYQLHSPLITH